MPAEPAHHPPHDDARDQRLVAAVRAGTPGAWQSLLTPYQDRLFAVVYRMVGPGPRNREIAADLTQDALVKIIQGLPSYDGSAKLSTWMIRVTMNVVLSWQRSQKHRRHASLDTSNAARSGGDPDNPPTLLSLLQSTELSPVSRVEQTQDRALMAQALASIDPDQRALLVLRDVRDLDYDQIAHVLSVPVGTVKSRLFRARASLRQVYQQLADHAKPDTAGKTPSTPTD